MATMTANSTQDGRLSVLRDASHELILSEIAEQEKRSRLERTIRAAIEAGVSIDDISEATGFRPVEISRIADRQEHHWDLEYLLGLK